MSFRVCLGFLLYVICLQHSKKHTWLRTKETGSSGKLMSFMMHVDESGVPCSVAINNQKAPLGGVAGLIKEASS